MKAVRVACRVPTSAGSVLCAFALAALGFGASAAVAAEQRVSLPSLDGTGHAPVVLTGVLFTAARSPAPAVVLLHGCGGAYDRNGALSRRMRDYAALFNGIGMHALVVDSLTPRHEKELCTQRLGTRRVTQVNRRLDALGAIAFLAERADVDAKRIGLVGWSNGGSTVLAATNLEHANVAGFQPRPAFAVAFYPGCEADRRRGYAPSTPLLILTGGADDWTPAAPCAALAGEAAEPKPEIEIYPGAWHGFDSDAPIRVRKDVPNGARPGQGVHVGGDTAAWRASRDRLLRFVAEH